MIIRIVTFSLAGELSVDDYAAHCEKIAASFNDWPGLLAKFWLNRPDDNTFGGVYVFSDQDGADTSRSSPQFRAMQSNERFVDLRIEEFELLDAPTAATTRRLLA